MPFRCFSFDIENFFSCNFLPFSPPDELQRAAAEIQRRMDMEAEELKVKQEALEQQRRLDAELEERMARAKMAGEVEPTPEELAARTQAQMRGMMDGEKDGSDTGTLFLLLGIF